MYKKLPYLLSKIYTLVKKGKKSINLRSVFVVLLNKQRDNIIGIQLAHLKDEPNARINTLWLFMGQMSGYIIESASNDLKKQTISDKEAAEYEECTCQIYCCIWV